MTRIDTATAVDLPFPTSQELDGSDAVHPDPDHSAAYLWLETADAGLTGHRFVLTIGRVHRCGRRAVPVPRGRGLGGVMTEGRREGTTDGMRTMTFDRPGTRNAVPIATRRRLETVPHDVDRDRVVRCVPTAVADLDDVRPYEGEVVAISPTAAVWRAIRAGAGTGRARGGKPMSGPRGNQR